MISYHHIGLVKRLLYPHPLSGGILWEVLEFRLDPEQSLDV